jgi:hypothetical protein
VQKTGEKIEIALPQAAGPALFLRLELWEQTPRVYGIILLCLIIRIDIKLL